MFSSAAPKLLVQCLLLAAVVVVVRGFPGGAPNFVCRRMRPLHPFPEQTMDTFPVDVRFTPQRAMPGAIVTVSVTTKDPADLFYGLLATALDVEGSLMSGFMVAEGDSLKLLDCTSSGERGSGVTHTERLYTNTKSFGWRVPVTARLRSQYVFRLTVVRNVAEYWVGGNTTFTVGPPPPPPPRTRPRPASPRTPPLPSGGTGSASLSTAANTGNRPSGTGNASPGTSATSGRGVASGSNNNGHNNNNNNNNNMAAPSSASTSSVGRQSQSRSPSGAATKRVVDDVSPQDNLVSGPRDGLSPPLPAAGQNSGRANPSAGAGLSARASSFSAERTGASESGVARTSTDSRSGTTGHDRTAGREESVPLPATPAPRRDSAASGGSGQGEESERAAGMNAWLVGWFG